ncbi:LUD domain-containing protein [Daejeonella sp. JGW-45]|uniref:LutC/YkgG family protein n=1 Tax=Daejeonella sp. JGW-45 TaxID=3034148 RepID=UPI0023ED216C|nr:LUD domain-containing protein [Daejeonella sp. JGW-45]
MEAREKILQAVTANKPDLIELPEMDLSQAVRYSNLVEQFMNVLKASGADTFFENSGNLLVTDIDSVKQQGDFMINLLEKDERQEWEELTASELKGLDTCYIRAQLGVAENGAMWISEEQMSNRLLPFICQHLVIVLDPADIVDNMHQAYQQIKTGHNGFGVFIAGPSKTADIEQNLVIGAHGARSLRVYVI